MRKKSAYKPKEASKTAHLKVVRKMKPLEAGGQDKIGVAYRVHLDALCMGKGDGVSLAVISTTLNLCYLLTQAGYGDTHREQIIEAMDATREATTVYRKHGRPVYTGPGLTALKFATAVFDEQLKYAPIVLVKEALETLYGGLPN